MRTGYVKTLATLTLKRTGVVVKDANNNKRRMCVDYSQIVNLITELDAYSLPRIETLINDLAKYYVFSTFDLHSAYHQIQITEKDRPFTAFEASGKLWEFTRIPFWCNKQGSYLSKRDG